MTKAEPERLPIRTTGNELDMVGELPRELSWLLIAAGIGGILLPGPVGTPFLLLGGATLFPRLFVRFENGFRKRFPRCHRRGVQQIKRYITDMERRYPSPA
jgi:hypothetical protein